MEGIIFLSSTEIITTTYSIWAVWSAFIVLGVFMIIGMFSKDTEIFGILMLLGMLAALLTGVTWFFASERQINTGRYEHRVLISDDVEFKKLYEKYDVKSMDGLTYIIEEREVTSE